MRLGMVSLAIAGALTIGARECPSGNCRTDLPQSNGSRSAGDASAGNQALAPSLLFIERWEGFRSVAYRDCGRGVWTIGYGRTEGVREGETTTKEKEETWLRKRVEKTRLILLSRLTVEFSADQLIALESLTYNIGLSRVTSSKGWRLLNQGNFDGCALEWFDADRGFVRAGGRVLPGLVARRAAELKLFERGERCSGSRCGSSPPLSPR